MTNPDRFSAPRAVGKRQTSIYRKLDSAPKTMLDPPKSDAAARSDADPKALADAIDSKVTAANTPIAATSRRIDGVASESRVAQARIDQNAQALEKHMGRTPEQISVLLATLG